MKQFSIDPDQLHVVHSDYDALIESGINRVRVPFSKGFQYSVRPQNRTGGVVDKRRQQSTAPPTVVRGKLGKRILEKGRAVSKNVRSANISIEGRATKG